ncbi:hypothetical protein PspLS_09908 [Pyricularia sp. CBS 133598]|nr:hypothetical protein PspLS_09908 [Pyricularia sp. CBS 133598]
MRKARHKTSATPLNATVPIKASRRRPPAFNVLASIAVNASLPTVGDSRASRSTALSTTPACLAQIGVLPSRRARLRPWTCKARKAGAGAGGSAGRKDCFVSPESGGDQELTGLRVFLNELIPERVGVDPWKFCAVNITPAPELLETKDDIYCVVSAFFLKLFLKWDTSLPCMGLRVEQKDEVFELHTGWALRRDSVSGIFRLEIHSMVLGEVKWVFTYATFATPETNQLSLRTLDKEAFGRAFRTAVAHEHINAASLPSATMLGKGAAPDRYIRHIM